MLKALSKRASNADQDFIEIVKHSFWAFFMLGLAGVIQIAFDYVLARQFGAEGVGLFYLSFSFVFMLSLLGRLGFNKAVVKYIPGFVQAKKWPELGGLRQTADRLTLTLSFALTIVGFILAPAVARDIFHQQDAVRYVQFFLLSLVPLSLMYVRTGFLSGLKRVKESVFIERVSVNAAGIIVMIIFGTRYGLNSIVIGTVVATYVFAFLARLVIARSFPRPKVAKNFDRRALLLLALPLLFVDFSNQMTGQVNLMILGAQLPASFVGVFNTALRVSTVIGIILTGINAIATTKVSELYHKGDMKQLSLVASKTAGFGLLCGLPLIIGFLAAPATFLGFFGKDFVSGATALRILVIAQAVNLGFGSVVQILSMTGYHKQLAYATIGTALLLNVALSIVLVPVYGINGAAIAVAVSLVAKNAILLVMIRKYLGIWSLPFSAVFGWGKSLFDR